MLHKKILGEGCFTMITGGGGVLYNEHGGGCFTMNTGGGQGVLYGEHRGVGRGALQ